MLRLFEFLVASNYTMMQWILSVCFFHQKVFLKSLYKPLYNRPFLSFKCQKFTWKSENFSVTYNFKVINWYKNYTFYLIRFEVQPQVRKRLRPMSQRPPWPEVTHNAMLSWILEKTSPIRSWFLGNIWRVHYQHQLTNVRKEPAYPMMVYAIRNLLHTTVFLVL